MTTPKLELRNLVKSFGDFTAVDGIDLTVESGQTVALLGPSGCGKSTTLNMIVGLETPSSGDILIDGQSVLGQTPQERRIGLVFQDYAVFTHMTVRKNLSFGLSIHGASKADIEKEVGWVAELLHLDDVMDEKPSALGSSELQRIAIGRTLVTKPALLLLDEPLSNLEADLRTKMRQQLRELQAETGKTIIYVTHDQIEALSLADRIAVMSDGRLRQVDTPYRIYNDPEHTFVGSFLGSPPMNLLPGRLQRDDQHIYLTQDESRLELPAIKGSNNVPNGADVFLGVRPEALRLEKDPSGGPALSAQIALVELLGADAILTVRTGAWEFKVLAPAGAAAKRGQTVDLSFDLEHTSIFDANSGERLASGEFHA